MTSEQFHNDLKIFVQEFENFQQVFDHHYNSVNKTDHIDKTIAQDIERWANELHTWAENLFPAGTEKDTYLRQLAWCAADAKSWADLFSCEKGN